jgi:hypothetical protein
VRQGCYKAAPLDEKEAHIVKARLVPAPQSIELTDGPDVVFDSSHQRSLACATDVRRLEADGGDVQNVVGVKRGRESLARPPAVRRRKPTRIESSPRKAH